MTAKNSPILTFHKLRQRCEQPDSEAWQTFLQFYGPLLYRLSRMYSGDPAQADACVEATLRHLARNQFEHFRSTARESEREFLTDIRDALLDRLGEEGSRAHASPDGNPAELSLDLEALRKLLEDLPLLHQEMLFFKMAGYTDATIERILRISPRVAQNAFPRLESAYGAALQRSEDRCPWPAQWVSLLREARGMKQEHCQPLHEFVRIHDGQVSWYEKEPVEKHISSGCLFCLERWTAVREVGYWRHEAERLSARQVRDFLEAIPLSAPEPKPLFRRLFGQRSR